MPVAVTNRFREAQPVWGESTSRPFLDPHIGDLHRSIPSYAPTPLVELPSLAARLGIGRLLVKDEAHRFGLKAFKGLGASYASAARSTTSPAAATWC